MSVGLTVNMPIRQLKKQSDLEKRLLLLRRQVYGKETLSFSKQTNQHQFADSKPATEAAYLKHDLIKILFFSSLAIGIQIFIAYLIKNNILNINF